MGSNTQIAHNLLLWLKQWTIDAIEFAQRCEQWVKQIKQKLQIEIDEAKDLFKSSISMLQQITFSTGKSADSHWLHAL